jgi:hypothetical protein
LLVSPGTEELDLLGVNQPADEILEEPEEHLPMHPRQRVSPAAGGKYLTGRKSETRAPEKTVGQHDRGQMPV